MPNRRRARSGLSIICIAGRVGLVGDLDERLSKRGDGLWALGLCRLDHQSLFDDEREVHRRRVKAELHEPFGDIEGGEAHFVVKCLRRDDALVHHGAVIGNVVGAAQALL